MKQSKLRRKRVFRYAVLYFVMLVVFVGLIVGPVVGGKMVGTTLSNMVPKSLALVQPNDLNNDDTRGDTATGIHAETYTGRFRPTASGTAASPAATQTEPANKIRLF